MIIQVITGTSPERYAAIVGRYLIMLQIEQPGHCSIIQTLNNNAIKGAAVVLYGGAQVGNPSDQLINFIQYSYMEPGKKHNDLSECKECQFSGMPETHRQDAHNYFNPINCYPRRGNIIHRTTAPACNKFQKQLR